MCVLQIMDAIARKRGDYGRVMQQVKALYSRIDELVAY
jgi:hypothetical protein